MEYLRPRTLTRRRPARPREYRCTACGERGLRYFRIDALRRRVFECPHCLKRTTESTLLRRLLRERV